MVWNRSSSYVKFSPNANYIGIAKRKNNVVFI